MALIIGLPEKEIQKVNKDLYELHKRVILNYLLSRSLKLRSRKKFFIVYGHYITEKNIHEYFYTPIHIFVQLLIRNELWRCRKYHKDTNIIKNVKENEHRNIFRNRE